MGEYQKVRVSSELEHVILKSSGIKWARASNDWALPSSSIYDWAPERVSSITKNWKKNLSNVGWGIAPILHINFGPLKRLAILNRTDVNEILTIYEFMMLTMFLCQIGVIFFAPSTGWVSSIKVQVPSEHEHALLLKVRVTSTLSTPKSYPCEQASEHARPIPSLLCKAYHLMQGRKRTSILQYSSVYLECWN